MAACQSHFRQHRRQDRDRRQEGGARRVLAGMKMVQDSVGSAVPCVGPRPSASCDSGSSALQRGDNRGPSGVGVMVASKLVWDTQAKDPAHSPSPTSAGLGGRGSP